MRILPRPLCVFKLFIFCLACAHPTYADKPERGHGNKHNQPQSDKHENGDQRDYARQHYFNDQHRLTINQYYGEQRRAGHCPPGLQKKHNGCLPPGQAKKWTIGQRLPRDVRYYEVPVTIFGPAPAGYRFVRVASDILMIAIGSGMVMDALTDLNGM